MSGESSGGGRGSAPARAARSAGRSPRHDQSSPIADVRLVSGIVAMPKGAFSRADRPASYWRWVAFHAVIVALLIGFVIVERTRVIIL